MDQQLIGILGGTFDPVHLGHLHLATQIKTLCNLDKILFVPCWKSPLRDLPQTSPEERYAMLKLAIDSVPYFAIDDRELKLHKPSFMLETLQSLREELPNAALCLIMGIDAFCRFNEWHKWQMIPEFAHLIIANRPQAPKLEQKELIALIAERKIESPSQLKAKNAGFIYCTDINPLPIAATTIRWMIKSSQDASRLVPKAVWQYICKMGLYRSNAN